ncbi:putative unusual protein kinase [Trachipleistophora hominis]|uniref:Putative unusual protein kinase n=1 Tax=Trachipleistophora hominis TaxID=72359 RepID=L7JVS2_TRAHO|nr:putative unusual protein kinase [Trachipleistophora hominis]
MFTSIFSREPYNRPKYRYRYHSPYKFPISDQLYRLCRLSCSIIPPILAYPFPSEIYYKTVYSFFANNGYVVMKLGQWLATRTDLLSIGLCKVLSTLHNEAPAHPFVDTLEILRNEMYDISLFHFVTHKPIGSGSVAQVYKVIINDEIRTFSFFWKHLFNFPQNFFLTDSRQIDTKLDRTKNSREILRKHGHKTLAIKIIHPNTTKDVYLDCQILTNAAKVLSVIPALSCLNINEQILHFQNEILKQIDLTGEERNMKVMRHLTRYDKNILIAEPIMATKNVLIMEYLEGESIVSRSGRMSNQIDNNRTNNEKTGLPLHDTKNESSKEFSKNKNMNFGLFKKQNHSLSVTALTFFVKSLFYNEFIHTDLHPGNVSVTKSNKLILYDFGLTKFLSHAEHRNLIDLFCSLFIEKNGLIVGDLLVERLACNKNVDKKKFRGEINELINHYFKQVLRMNGNSTRNDAYMITKEYGFKAIRLFNKYNVKIDYKYNQLFVTAFCFDGILRQIQPDCTFYGELDQLIWKFGPTLYLLKQHMVRKLFGLGK